MVGNTYHSCGFRRISQPYTTDDWKEDIALAASHGIDGFALNVGREEWQRESIARCYAAALEVGAAFRLFLSFDMTVLPSARREDVAILRDYVEQFAYHPHQLWHKGGVLVSTFAGQDSLFGFGSLHAAWTFVKDALHEIAPIHLIPSFFMNPQQYPHLRFMDGYFNWNGSWPIHLTVHSPREEIECAKLDTDRHHIHHLGGRTFMAAVSPWFFTHYGAHSWNKNVRSSFPFMNTNRPSLLMEGIQWIYRGDDWLFVRRWEQLIAMRDQVDIVQVISWNDYGESHYIGPIKGAQPNSEAWVDGFPHEAWLDLQQYYVRAFKEGAYPVIKKDRIFMWSRPHMKSAEAMHDVVPRPERWQLTDDRFWVIVFATEPTEVHLSSTTAGNSGQTYLVHRGVSKLSHPIVPGGSMHAKMVRNGAVVAECAPSRAEFEVQEQPRMYNFNVYVAASPYQ
ncbi:glycoside hydrolase family 71 protein [Fomes fomentarius]|nr:glycoside hydrolase family 71 protein [Fomes fomentarius]